MGDSIDPFGDSPAPEPDDEYAPLTLDERIDAGDDDMGSRDVEREEGRIA